MSEDVHARAERLITQQRVEGVPPAEHAWLDQHLQGCSQCAEFAAGIERALRSWRSVSVPVPRALASRTQLRVRLRVQEMGERQPGLWALWISCILSWILGVASAPFVWRAFAWAGHEVRLPAFVWEAGFVLWWILPACTVGGILAWRRLRRADDEVNSEPLGGCKY